MGGLWSSPTRKRRTQSDLDEPEVSGAKGTYTSGVHLVIDGNNVAWAGFHALRRPMDANTPEKYVRAALLGLTQSVIGFAVRAGEPPEAGPGRVTGQSSLFDPPPTRISRLTVAFDEGRPLRRREIYPRYQTGRESDSNFMEFEQYVLTAIEQFSEFAASLPAEIIRGRNTEADDLIAATVLGSQGTVRICSTDRDFLQLVDERVSIYSPVRRLVVTTENFSEATAPKSADGTPSPFPRERYLEYRAASGDASDDLPGIPGVGALTAAKLLNAASLDEYLARPSRLADVLGRRNARIEAAFASGEAAAVTARNLQLMDLRAAAVHYPDLTSYTSTGRWDEPAFRAWVKEQRVAAMDVEAAVACMSHVAAASDARS